MATCEVFRHAIAPVTAMQPVPMTNTPVIGAEADETLSFQGIARLSPRLERDPARQRELFAWVTRPAPSPIHPRWHDAAFEEAKAAYWTRICT